MAAYSQRNAKGGSRSGSSRPFFTAHSLGMKGVSRRPHSSSGTRRAYSPASGGGPSAVRAQSASRRKNLQPGISKPGEVPTSYRYTYFGNDRKRRAHSATNRTSSQRSYVVQKATALASSHRVVSGSPMRYAQAKARERAAKEEARKKEEDREKRSGDEQERDKQVNGKLASSSSSAAAAAAASTTVTAGASSSTSVPSGSENRSNPNAAPIEGKDGKHQAIDKRRETTEIQQKQQKVTVHRIGRPTTASAGRRERSVGSSRMPVPKTRPSSAYSGKTWQQRQRSQEYQSIQDASRRLAARNVKLKNELERLQRIRLQKDRARMAGGGSKGPGYLSHRARPGSAHSQRSRRQKDALGFSRQRPTTAGVPRPKTSNLDRSALNTRTALSNAAARVSYGRSDKGGVNTTASTRPQTAAGTLDVMGRIKSIISAPGWDGRGHPHFYKFGKIVGQGSFGTVRMVGHLLSNMTVAIKSYDKSKIKDKAHLKRIQQEVRLMERLNHPYVIRLFETIESTKRVHLVMELASGGNLCSYVKSRKRLSEREGKYIFDQICLALEYLHGINVVHRDVKLENILFDSNRNVKLSDFGFSVHSKDKRLKIFCGTPSYMAPEIVMRREYKGRPVDVWSLGVLLYAMLCGCFPFTASNYPNLYKRIIRGQFRVPEYLTHTVRDLLRCMVCVDPAKRYTMQQVRRHPWSSGSERLPKPLPNVTHLVSDNPSDDLDSTVLDSMVRLGFNRAEIIESVLGRRRNQRTACYYLLRSKALAAKANSSVAALTQAAAAAKQDKGKSGSNKDARSEGEEVKGEEEKKDGCEGVREDCDVGGVEGEVAAKS